MNWKVFRRTFLKFVRRHFTGFFFLGSVLLGIIGCAIGSCVAGEAGAVCGFIIGILVPMLIVIIIYGINWAFHSIKDAIIEFKDMYLADLDNSDK